MERRNNGIKIILKHFKIEGTAVEGANGALIQTTNMSPSWMDERLISPVTLLNLTQTYDNLISRLQKQQQQENNATTNNNDAAILCSWWYDSLRNLHLACALLVKIYNIASTENNTGTGTGGGDLKEAARAHCIIILQQTARRCQLLLEVLRLTSASPSKSTTTAMLWDHDDDDYTIHDMENVHVEAHAHHQSLFSWNFSATIDLSGVELEAEELNLIQMANTPIPTEQEQGNNNNNNNESSSSSSAALLIEQEKERLYVNMRLEWGDAACDQRSKTLDHE